MLNLKIKKLCSSTFENLVKKTFCYDCVALGESEGYP